MLDRKLWRDLRRMKGQAIAVSLVMACGVTMMVMARSLIYSLESTLLEYYQAHRFADVFAQLKRAPNVLAARAAEIPGVSAVQASLSVQVTLDLPGMDEPASGLMKSVPDHGPPELNRLFLRAGRWLAPNTKGDVLVGEAFANANHLKPGDPIAILLNGRRIHFTVAGIVLSPEYVFESRPGSALPDNRTYGIFWMRYTELASAFDLDGAFNFIVLSLEPRVEERSVMASLDRLLAPYGGRSAFGRGDHPSHIRVSDEIRVLEILSIGFPLVFLSVAAFMTNSVLSRLVSLQREQIAILKAFGFSNRQIGAHFIKFAFVMVAGGATFGGVGGVLLGHQLVGMYHLFFRFPELAFRFDYSALILAIVVSAIAATLGVVGAIRRAANLPPADAMRPEPPANYRPAFVERTGIGHLLTHSFRIAIRNLERKPTQAFFTIAGLSLATGILIVPNCFRDGVKHVLGFQWDVVQRQYLTIGLVEPDNLGASYALRHLPGALHVEPIRNAAVRIHFNHRHRQLPIQGIPVNGRHNRVIDSESREVALPAEGIVVSAKLAEVLGARVGDELIVEVLEGKRPVRPVRLAAMGEDFAGLTAFMRIETLNRLLGEGDVISGATFSIDTDRKSDFLRALKNVPRVGSVVIKESLRANFEETTAASINLLQTLYLILATIVAFGVVYNNARISLAERARELATLRVIGFSKREVGAVLVTELVILALVAVPLGLLIGTGFATFILKAVNTETVRLPLVLTSSNYAFAALTVSIASTLSALIVLRLLHHLNLVGALKAPE